MVGNGRTSRRGHAGTRRTYSSSARVAAAAAAGNGNKPSRFTAVRIILVAVLGIAGLKLVYVQAFEAEALTARAEQQRTATIDIPAQRGSIIDRNGVQLAFSVEVRTLSVNLRLMRKEWSEVARKKPGSGENFDTRAAEAAEFIAAKLPDKTSEQELLERFHKDGPFTYLVDNIEPSVAEEITEQFPEIASEKRAQRQYPGDTLAADIIGVANWRMENPDQSKHNLHGLAGLESARDKALAGTPGQLLAETARGNNNVILPGTRELQPAVPGSDLELTIDSDLQYVLQNKLSDYVQRSRADGGSAIVLDTETGEVFALANDKTFNPNEFNNLKNPALMNNRAVTTPFEPGSVNKVITAAAAIEAGITTPDSVLQVPDSLRVADHTVHDAWNHATLPFTTTGIFAKSSNVGTLLLAQQLGEQRFAEMLTKFGLGQKTGIGMPGESSGVVPPRSAWSGTTFGNLPIGQGLSMTVVQMASMYQAIANDGLRIEPRIVRATVQPDGTRVPEPPPDKVQVVSPETADTVKNMLRAVTQDGEGMNDGTAPAAAVEGFQVAGKTGTGQQIDPKTGAYSDELYNITFAGMLPADNPRFVVGIWLDAPDTTLPEGHSAAPLFHDIASYLAQRYQIPLSDEPTPVVPLVL